MKKTLDQRKQEFGQWIAECKGDYERDLLKEFYLYWTEKNPNGRKMRYEKEKTFDVCRRLATWAKNSKKWGKAKDKEVNEPTTLFERFRNKHGLSD